jgi:hypothetical protein
MFDPTYRPGDNLYTNSAISWDPDTGAMNWFFQYTPGDLWDYDEVGTHILIDGVVAGQVRKLVTHSARNGFLYTGAPVGARCIKKSKNPIDRNHGIYRERDSQGVVKSHIFAWTRPPRVMLTIAAWKPTSSPAPGDRKALRT